MVVFGNPLFARYSILADSAYRTSTSNIIIKHIRKSERIGFHLKANAELLIKRNIQTIQSYTSKPYEKQHTTFHKIMRF